MKVKPTKPTDKLLEKYRKLAERYGSTAKTPKGILTFLRGKKFHMRRKVSRDEKLLLRLDEKRRKNNRGAAKIFRKFFPDGFPAMETKHRMGCVQSICFVSKDGQQHYFEIENTTRNYSGEWKGREAHGFVTTFLPLEEVVKGKIKVVGNIVTHFLEKVHPKVWKCKVLKTTPKKYSVVQTWEDGWFVTSTFHGKSLKDCLVWRKKEAEKKLSERLEKKKNKEKLEEMKNRFFGFQHSLNAGNCWLGTQNFCNRHQLNPEFGYRGDYLLSIASEKEKPFVEKILLRN